MQRRTMASFRTGYQVRAARNGDCKRKLCCRGETEAAASLAAIEIGRDPSVIPLRHAGMRFRSWHGMGVCDAIPVIYEIDLLSNIM